MVEEAGDHHDHHYHHHHYHDNLHKLQLSCNREEKGKCETLRGANLEKLTDRWTLHAREQAPSKQAAWTVDYTAVQYWWAHACHCITLGTVPIGTGLTLRYSPDRDEAVTLQHNTVLVGMGLALLQCSTGWR